MPSARFERPSQVCRRRPEADPRFERTTTSGEEMIARIAPAPFLHARACDMRLALLPGRRCARCRVSVRFEPRASSSMALR